MLLDKSELHVCVCKYGCVFPKGQNGHACFIHLACRMGLQKKCIEAAHNITQFTATQCTPETGVHFPAVTFASVSHFRNANMTPTVVPGVDLLGMNVGGISTSLKNMHSFFPVNVISSGKMKAISTLPPTNTPPC